MRIAGHLTSVHHILFPLKGYKFLSEVNIFNRDSYVQHFDRYYCVHILFQSASKF